MAFDVAREQWVERFAMHLSRLEVGAVPDDFVELARRLFATRGQHDPQSAADDEFAARRHAGARTGATAPDPAGETSFERTQRFPVERLATGEDHVRDNDEWISRCLARVLEVDPIIRPDEARRSATELAGLERWRLMKPEAAADQLYTPVRPHG